MKRKIALYALCLAAISMNSCQMADGNIGKEESVPDIVKPDAEQPKDETPQDDDSEEEADDDEKKEQQNTNFDFSVSSVCVMNVGDSIVLSSEIEGCSVYYEIESGEDIVSLDSFYMNADCVGEAVVKAYDWNEDTHFWSCIITVKADGFIGSSSEYKMIGTWYDEKSLISLNMDKTGYMRIYLNEEVVQDCDFKWQITEGGSYKYLKITEGDDYINKEYTLLKLTMNSFKISGYLAFGKPKETSWYK